MSFCPFCGVEILEPTQKYCVKCGEKLPKYEENQAQNNITEENFNRKENVSEIVRIGNRNINTNLKTTANSDKEDSHNSPAPISNLNSDKEELVNKNTENNEPNELIRPENNLQRQNENDGSNFITRSINTFKHNQEIKKHEREVKKAKEAEDKRIIESDTRIFINQLLNDAANLSTLYPPIVMKKNEEAYMYLTNIKLIEPRKVSVRLGGYGGTSVRVAKGVTLHTGGTRGRSVSHDELREIDTGTLTLTNKRLIFTGSVKSVTCNLNKLVTVQALNDGIMVQVENRQKPSYFRNTNKNSLNFIGNSGRQLTIPISGEIMQAAVQGKASNL